MSEIIRITNPLIFSSSEYEILASQLPRFTLRGSELLAYISKIVTLGELHALVVNDALKGLVGFYANDLRSKMAYLSCLVVDQSCRGSGNGQCLVDKMFESCRLSGMKGISLNVVSDNFRAIAFYQRNGFVVSGLGRDEYHLLMTASISNSVSCALPVVQDGQDWKTQFGELQ